jgi:hypothetical protein
MFHTLVSVLFVLAQPANPVTEPGPAPQLGIAELDRDGNPVLRRGRTVFKLVVEVVEVQVGGKTQKVPVQKTIAQEVVEYVRLDGAKVQVFQADGKRIAPDGVGRFINGPMPVLVSADGKMVDRLYLRLVREGTLVVLLPGSAQVPQPVAPPKAGPVPNV